MPTPVSGQGRASSVTDLGDGTVLRLGGNPETEAEMMELARAHGVPVPRVHEVRPDGLVLALVPGATLAAAMRRRLWTLPAGARTIAELHELVHRIPFGAGQLVHYDLHPENVIASPDGPVLIDWTNARAGEPEADIALTWLIAETSDGIGGRLFARWFRRVVGREPIRRGFAAARDFRLADRHVTDDERHRVRQLRP